MMIPLLLLTAPPPAPPTPVLEILRQEARAHAPRVRSPWVRRFLELVEELPSSPRRVFLHTADKQRYFTEAEAAKLPAAERGALVRREVDDEVYYARITEPLAYARPLELLAQAGFQPDGARLVDFGYGNIGQLKLLAWLGADASGIEVDPLLPLLYAGENGPTLSRDKKAGRLRVLHGFYPTDQKLVAEVGGGYDLFLSKNTLKKGYINPDRPVPKAMERALIKLGVSDEAFVGRVFAALKPGGLFLIYNICPPLAPPGQDFVPWSDGRSPFGRATYEKAGFEVLAFDVDDTAAMRLMAHDFGWDQPRDGEPGSKLTDLFAQYTLLRRPAAPAR